MAYNNTHLDLSVASKTTKNGLYDVETCVGDIRPNSLKTVYSTRTVRRVLVTQINRIGNELSPVRAFTQLVRRSDRVDKDRGLWVAVNAEKSALKQTTLPCSV